MDRRRRRRTGEIGRIESAVVDRGQELLLRAAGGRDFTSDTGPSIFFCSRIFWGGTSVGVGALVGTSGDADTPGVLGENTGNAKALEAPPVLLVVAWLV